MIILNNKKFNLNIKVSLDYADFKVVLESGENEFPPHIYDAVLKTKVFKSLKKEKFVSIPAVKVKKEKDDISSKPPV